ncbi:FtsK/SpoIIIE domain-containing protein [Actinomycetes bacterium KLBMP 9797]
MRNSRAGLVADVRRDLAQARGLTLAALGAAETARVAAHRRRDEAQARHSERVSALAAAREAARTAVRDRHRQQAVTLAAGLAAVAASGAPGAAGAPWSAWRPTEPERGRRPGLVRIGTIGYDDAGTALPALVPLLDHAHLSFTGESSTVDRVIAGLLLRVLGSTRPGEVRLTVYDPEQLGGSLAGFAPLGNADLLSFVGPGGLTGMLDDLVEQIRRINESVLAGEYASLAELTAATAARRPEPWRLVVLLGDAATAEDLTTAQRAQLDRIVRTGVACGVHVLARGLPIAHPATVEHVEVLGGTARCEITGDLRVTLDAAPPADRIAAVCRELAELMNAGPPAAEFVDLLPEKLWAECSASGLSAPLGDGPDGDLVEVLLGDDPPHALIGGPSGSGKTNLIYAWLGALATRYGPDELALYLLDFKEGVSFARFAPGRRDPSWLPQVRLVGVNVNSDREFGLALLRHLGDELRRRAAAAKRHEATKLAELRAEDPGGHWPRVVAVIDEFQVLLAGRDALATEAVTLLEDLARRGRSQGIHLVLASQDVSGIEALWGRSALVAQFTLRIALPKARRILADTNLAADVIPRFHAVVNADSGVATANRIVRLPDASDRSTWRALQEKLWHARPEDLAPPHLFDGDAVPSLSAALRALGRDPSYAINDNKGPLLAVVGETIDVQGRPAVVRLPRAPGRNLAVIGTRIEDACAVLGAAGRSLASSGAAARFSVVCLDDDASSAAGLLHAALPDARWYDADTAQDLITSLAEEPAGPPHYVIGYAWDAGQLTGLRAVLTRGPERHIHVLGWWRGVSRLRDDLGGVGARFDAIGAWVALDVHGSELSPLSPQPGGPTWYPRPHRALFFDRATHRAPEVVIPYRLDP